MKGGMREKNDERKRIVNEAEPCSRPDFAVCGPTQANEYSCDTNSNSTPWFEPIHKKSVHIRIACLSAVMRDADYRAQQR
jgi:hypothetical protein